ncbi:MAG: type III pantothenate kinase [Candidatus Omnitrophica bacterium]|nr:type III pantothenate kinase [Candidatus Omnitrophota bacterium]
MLLAIDIGNTNITFRLFRADRIKHCFNIPTQDYNLRNLRQNLRKLKIDNAIICSVVPPVTRKIERDLRSLLGRQPQIIGKHIRVPIKNLYRNPKAVGQDRLVNAYAGVKLYGAPLVVVDFGTAVTFDVISKKKEYRGGMILPGLRISLEALNARTALLPKIKLEGPKEFIGRDTKSSMLSGIIYGFSALTDNLIARLKHKLGKKTKAIGTGGNIGLISRYCRSLDGKDIRLTLKGLNMLFLQQKNT